MPYDQILWAALLVISAVLLWGTNLLGLPGNWFVLAAALAYSMLASGQTRLDIGWPTLLAMLALAAVGELLEFLAGALGAARAGGSRRSALLAMLGSLAGAAVGVFVGLPLPVGGPIVGALLCASLGALGGAFLGEQWKGRELDASLRVGHAAFWGRLLGTVGKITVGAGMLILLAAALLL